MVAAALITARVAMDRIDTQTQCSAMQWRGKISLFLFLFLFLFLWCTPQLAKEHHRSFFVLVVLACITIQSRTEQNRTILPWFSALLICNSDWSSN